MDAIPLGAKRRLSSDNDYTKCIICQTKGGDNGPLNKLTERGYDTFKESVEIRKDQVYDRLWKDIQNKQEFLNKSPLCHRKCRSDYTHKKKLETFCSAKLFRDEPNISEKSRVGRRKAIDYKLCCFLCEKERDVKGNRTIISVCSVQRQKSIHKKAKELNDEEVLLKIIGHGDQCIDLIAHGFRYHRRCMNEFMNKRPNGNIPISSCNIHDVAFERLLSEISDNILKKDHAYFVSHLSKRYTTILSEYSMDSDISFSFRKDRLVKRLLNHFGSSVQAVNLKGRGNLICPSSLTVKDMCEQVITLQSELDESSGDYIDLRESNEYCDISNAAYHVAKSVRKNVKLLERERGQNDTETLDMSYDGALSHISIELYNLIAWLVTEVDELTGPDGRVPLPLSDKERVLNIAQDVTWCISKQPLPKHIGIAIHILKQTRSKNLITILNRLGNCISYNTAQRYITDVARRTNEQEKKDGFFMPANLTYGHFTHYALDNLNFHSEAQDGGGLDATTHSIYQYSSDEDRPDSPLTISTKKTRDVTLENPGKFVPNETTLTLKDRRDARSLSGVKISESGNENCILLDDNIVWYLLRMLPTNLITRQNDLPISIPTWNRFYELKSSQEKPQTLICYGPMFPQTPTRPDVVQTSLDYFISVNFKLGHSTTVITCDQAIYDIIKALVNKNPIKYSGVVLRLGGFHIAQNFLGTIGFFMKESGIEDILVLSNICGRGTANKIIAGKDYYRMVRYHSWVCEAIFMLMWESFEKWISFKNECDTLSNLPPLLEALGGACQAEDSTIETKVGNVIAELFCIEDLWKDFKKNLGTTAQLWIMYIEMVLILKRYITAERSGDWEGHLRETENMLPYTVSSGHTKYMSCLPIYLDEMNKLPEYFPELYEELKLGNFTVRKTKGMFNGVWADLALEQTYNKEGKTTLFKGLTEAECTREKYIKTLPFMTAMSEKIKIMAHIDAAQSDHHEKVSKNDLDVVLTIKEKVLADFINPFQSNPQTDNQLVNIVTGEILSSTDLVRAKQIGLEAIAASKSDNTGMIKTPKITTFGSKRKGPGKNTDFVRHILKEESTVTRALCFAQQLSDEEKIDAFSYEWMSYPPSLFQPDTKFPGRYEMRKGAKSQFFKVIQNEAGSVSFDELPSSPLETLYIIDAMAFIQRFQTLGMRTFGQLQSKYLEKILEMKPTGCSVVHFVGDRYDMGIASLKANERHRREKEDQSRVYIPTDSACIPAWNDFLGNPKNKENLLKYLALSWSTRFNTLPEGFTLSITENAEVVCITKTGTSRIGELCCPLHEEADTRIFAHIAVSNQPRVIIQATDTDIIMLSMYYLPRFDHIEEMWIEKTNEFIPVHDTVNSLVSRVYHSPLHLTNILLCLYVLTGCDSVSYPYKIGKNKAAKLAIQFLDKFPLLSCFDCTDHITDDLVSEAREYFCALYGKPEFLSLNELRAHLFASSKRDLRSLPPTEDAFRLHFLRSLCQINLYKQAFRSDPIILNLEDYGRHLDNGMLLPTMITKAPKPKLATLAFCKCKKDPRCKKNCPCYKATIPCTIACSCGGSLEKCYRIRQDNTLCSDTDED